MTRIVWVRRRCAQPNTHCAGVLSFSILMLVHRATAAASPRLTRRLVVYTGHLPPEMTGTTSRRLSWPLGAREHPAACCTQCVYSPEGRQSYGHDVAQLTSVGRGGRPCGGTGNPRRRGVSSPPAPGRDFARQHHNKSSAGYSAESPGHSGVSPRRHRRAAPLSA